jgi:hypothetical protein
MKPLGLWKEEFDPFLVEFTCQTCLRACMRRANRGPARIHPQSQQPLGYVYVDWKPKPTNADTPDMDFSTTSSTAVLGYKDSDVPGVKFSPGSTGLELKTGISAFAGALVITDEATRYTWAIPCYDKSAETIALALRVWARRAMSWIIHTVSNTKEGRSAWPNLPWNQIRILALHSDGGTEFADAVSLFCEVNIIHQVCNEANTPWRNGVVEARIDLASSLTKKAQLDLCGKPHHDTWIAVFQHSIHTMNCMPSKIHGTRASPLERLTGKSPTAEMIFTYGTPVVIRDEGRTSVSQPKGIAGYAVNYQHDTRQRGVRVFRATRGGLHKIFVRTHVRWDRLGSTPGSMGSSYRWDLARDHEHDETSWEDDDNEASTNNGENRLSYDSDSDDDHPPIVPNKNEAAMAVEQAYHNASPMGDAPIALGPATPDAAETHECPELAPPTPQADVAKSSDNDDDSSQQEAIEDIRDVEDDDVEVDEAPMAIIDDEQTSEEEPTTLRRGARERHPPNRYGFGVGHISAPNTMNELGFKTLDDLESGSTLIPHHKLPKEAKLLQKRVRRAMALSTQGYLLDVKAFNSNTTTDIEDDYELVESSVGNVMVLAVSGLNKSTELGQKVRSLKDVPRDEIKEAILKEVSGLLDASSFEAVPEDTIKDQGIPIMRFVWVIKVKSDDTVKARLCIGGNTQTQGLNFWETSSPTPRASTVKLALGIAASKNWHVNMSDVSQAFLQSLFGATAYMRMPKEVLEIRPDWKGCVLKLLRSLYGAKQSGRNWFQEAVDSLTEFGYRQCQKDPCVFTSHSEQDELLELILLYVDDFLVLAPPDRYELFFKKMSSKYKITSSDLDQRTIKIWNGLEIRRHGDGKISVTQIAKIREMAREFEAEVRALGDSRYKCSTPEVQDGNQFHPKDMVEDPQNLKKDEAKTLRRFQQMAGSVNYVATYTRFDVAHAMSKASKLMHGASDIHVTGMARVLRYLIEHEDIALTYDGAQGGEDSQPHLFTFVDSDYAGEPAHLRNENDLGRKSTTAVIIMAFGAPLYWKSKLQKTVATATGEAEIRALHYALKEVEFLVYLLMELGFKSGLVPIFSDASTCISQVKRDGMAWLEGSRQYQVEISDCYHAMRHRLIVPLKIRGPENPADLLTKKHMKNLTEFNEHILRISGASSVPFNDWIRRHFESFDGTTAAIGGFLSKDELLAACGLGIKATR